MSRSYAVAALILLAAFASSSAQAPSASGRDRPAIRNAAGLQLLVVTEHSQPVLRVVLPGHASSDRSIEVLFPEHVTAVDHGGGTAEHLYLFRPGLQGESPPWRNDDSSLTYERDLPHDVHMLARAMLESDGVRIHYEFTNHSAVAYDMITAVTDPRLTGIFHDVRLERTYVHLADGFDPIASETPSRLTMPLGQWLPARYLASVTAPVPAQRVQNRDDGITYYYKSRRADVPFIATRSTDSSWMVASFARAVADVWTNPELTCQHVDPQAPLAPGGRATVEVKILILRGSLDDALRRAIRQRGSLR